MAIARDANATIVSNTGSTPTWSHTCTGANLYLVVGMQVATGETVSGATYNGVSMTQLNTQAISGATFSNVYLFGLSNPATGAHNVIVTKSGSSYGYGGSLSYTGVSGTDGDNATFNSSSTSNTTSITTTVQNDWLVGFACMDPNATLSAGTGTSVVALIDVWAGLIDSNGARATGSNSLQVNRSTSGRVGQDIVALKPVVAGGGAFLLNFV